MEAEVRRNTIIREVIFLASLGIVEYLIFSDCFSYFFQGDALYWLQYRFRGWSDFFRALYTLDAANWYRPLSNRTIPALFFSWFGLAPYGYHWVVFILFFLSTCLVFRFLQDLTSNFFASAAGTTFFSIHSNNIYVTYAFAFAPELLYTAFYVLSCIAYLRGTYSKRWYVLSMVFFVLSLMSKEAAVTLPANLVLLSLLIVPRNKLRIRSFAPFLAILGIYYLYVVRYLKVGSGDYALSFHKDIPRRLADSFLTAFNIVGGTADPKRALPAIVLYWLIACVAVLVVYAAALLFTEKRRRILFGFGWFLVAFAPMLGIVAYFAGYYLFLPMVGISLVVGICAEQVFEKLRRFGPVAAIVATLVLFFPFIAAARINAKYDLDVNTALGYAGRIAEKSARDLKLQRASLPKTATVYIVNTDSPDLWRYFGLGSLLKLTYADDSIDVRYSSLGHTVNDLLGSDKLIVMKYQDGGLIDITAPFKRNPADYVTFQSQQDFEYVRSDRFNLGVSPQRIAAGSGSFTIRISGIADSDVETQYTINDGPLAFITLHVGPAGETRFFVSSETKRGSYRFVGFKLPQNSTWIQASAAITVTD